ncbi:hypothetical protein [Chitinophaga sp. sic0106]|uniref:hypothetical protein n=1 Tax=Chitinophaga sp. sic0106 TaxID=2854785 RepID=UPI001C4660B4|nr:hypothetical protein [Chitinophaga sp. sic0106]MBV7529841.1 hypothetical protein [Chitinophaga sp. sic0106]
MKSEKCWGVLNRKEGDVRVVQQPLPALGAGKINKTLYEPKILSLYCRQKNRHLPKAGSKLLIQLSRLLLEEEVFLKILVST